MNLNLVIKIIYLLASLGRSSQLLIVEKPGREPFRWEGCIFRRVNILHAAENGNKCTSCTVNGTTLAQFKSETRELYRNCTNECKKPTICTIYTYKLHSQIRPECYQCETWNNEKVYFRMTRTYEICSNGCKKCARTVDLATANQCSSVCLGKPTFCYPPFEYFGHEMCYQTNFTYGCNFEPELVNSTITDPKYVQCIKCARLATKETAQLCALDCQGKPTYVERVNEREKYKMQCRLGSFQDVVLHELPEEITFHIHQSHPMAAKNLTVHPHFK